MKHSFLRLISSFYILLISALMIVISAYAWMVISDSPAAGGIGFGVAGLDAWKLGEYDTVDESDFSLSESDVMRIYGTIEKDENGAYLIDSAEKFVAMMQLIHYSGMTEDVATVALDETSETTAETVSSETTQSSETSESAESLTESAVTPIILRDTVKMLLQVNISFEDTNVWSASDWLPVKVMGKFRPLDVIIDTDAEALGEEKVYFKSLVRPLFGGGEGSAASIKINNVVIIDSDIQGYDEVGNGAFIENVRSLHTITLENCHLLSSSLRAAYRPSKDDYARVGGLIGTVSGYQPKTYATDGYTNVYINGCSVEGSTLWGSSVGGINGHSGTGSWTAMTITNSMVKNTSIESEDAGNWRVGEIVGTVNQGDVILVDVSAVDNTLSQTGKTTPDGQDTLYGRVVPKDTNGKLAIVDSLSGEVDVYCGFINDVACILEGHEVQTWNVYGAITLPNEFQFRGNHINVVGYNNASITFSSVASGASYPGTAYASAGFNFIEMDGYTGTEDEIRAEKGSEINFNQIKFINNKTYGTDCTTKSKRHSYCMYALADSATYTDCTFEGSLVVYNSAKFDRCTFTESVDNRYCLFLDDVYDAEFGEYLIQNCTFTAASTAYGCVKVSEDATLYLTAGKDANDVFVGGTYTLNSSTFYNATHKPAVYVNGYANIVTDGNNKFYDTRENQDERTGGILAKYLELDDTENHTYATYTNGTESRVCLTIKEYTNDKTLWDNKSEFGNHSVVVSEISDEGQDSESTETTSGSETTTTVSSESASSSETTTTASSETASVSETTTAASTVTDEATPNGESQPTETTIAETTTTETTVTETTTTETTAESADNSLEANASETPESEETASENAGSEENAGESADGNAESSEEETTSSETASAENTPEASSEENAV